MFSSASTPATRPNRTIGLFLLCWTALNLLQAATLGLHSDEAYYWMYSRFLDWGYFDHPPMVAVFIKLGYSLFHNELGLRLVTVLINPLGLYLLWLIAKKYKTDARWFVVVVSGVLAFHIYGFITTPDAPLLFFTILFYYFYQQYLEEDKWTIALLLGITIACLLYSKYHGVLLIVFTVLANIKLFKRPSFYLIILLSAALYVPHILWQVNHEYPSLVYHLFERSSEVYQLEHTYLYIPGQLLMAGPLIGWFLFYYAFTTRIKNAFIRCLMVNAIGTLLFFLLNTIKGNVQPHWTLISFVPVVLLVLIHLRQPGSRPLWLYKLALVNAGLIILFRLLLIVQLPLLTHWRPVKSFFFYKQWAQQIQQKAGNRHVIIPSSFQEASKYNFYTQSLKGFDYDERYYRRTQYDLWPLEDSLQHQSALFVTDQPLPGLSTDSMLTVKGMRYFTPIANVRTFQLLDIELGHAKVEARPGQQLELNLRLNNRSGLAANFAELSQSQPVQLSACFFQGDELKNEEQAGAELSRLTVPAHGNANYRFVVKAPAQPGRYDLVFSVRTVPFAGGRNSRIINFTVR
ncbi:hypothetical protein GCM10027037_18260 [Mucilaginibacter koreensis]